MVDLQGHFVLNPMNEIGVTSVSIDTSACTIFFVFHIFYFSWPLFRTFFFTYKSISLECEGNKVVSLFTSFLLLSRSSCVLTELCTYNSTTKGHLLSSPLIQAVWGLQ